MTKLEKPTADQIKQKRAELKLTQQQCADLVHKNRLTWAKYEQGIRGMDLTTWELFLIKSAAKAAKKSHD